MRPVREISGKSLELERTAAGYPSQYWLLNPSKGGKMKSVITNSVSAGSPWNTEYGITPTNSANGISGPATDSSWAMYTTVITEDSITGYYNNQKIGYCEDIQ